MAEYSQPLPLPPMSDRPKRKVKPSAVEMSTRAQLLAERVRELYWLSTSRAPRTQQVHLGPSELGDPCDNKLVRRLAGLTPANHGRADGWAATVGTAGHAWLAEAIQEYDSGRGRFLVEHPIVIPAPADLGEAWDVHGTLDWYDRKERTVIDHKFLGEFTLDRIRTQGEPEQRYQIQLQIYAYGLALTGEEPEEVAVIAWPRVEATLNKLFVWVAPYDPDIAREALERRERLIRATIAADDPDALRQLLADTPLTPSAMCRYCYFYMPYATDVVTGCRGDMGAAE